MRPHIVWFGEVPLELPRVYQALDQAALFISIGSSGQVYPAAGFVHHIRQQGKARCIELNLAPSEGDSLYDETISGLASQTVPLLVDRLLSGRV